MREDGTMSAPTEAQVDAAIRVLRDEMTMPYMARVGDYLAADAQLNERTEGLAALRAADEEADRMNRDLIRRALKAAMES